MKQHIFFAVLFFFIPFFGCEEIIEDQNLPYIEKLVIRSVITDGDSVVAVNVGRTTPNEEYSGGYWSQSEGKYVTPELTSYVKDATVAIVVDNKKYLLQHFKDGLYKTDLLIIKSGKTYNLLVEWKDKKANAVTTIPATPILDSVSIAVVTKIDSGSNTHNGIIYEIYSVKNDYTFFGYARSEKNTVLSFAPMLSTTYKYNDTATYSSPHPIGTVVQKRTESNFSIANVLIKKYQIYTSRKTYFDAKVVFTLKSFDEPYYKYYLTSIGFSEGNNFSIEPKPVAWNVSGDAIGMFIGASKSVTKTYKLN